jgi:hypothetical protein
VQLVLFQAQRAEQFFLLLSELILLVDYFACAAALINSEAEAGNVMLSASA